MSLIFLAYRRLLIHSFRICLPYCLHIVILESVVTMGRRKENIRPYSMIRHDLNLYVREQFGYRTKIRKDPIKDGTPLFPGYVHGEYSKTNRTRSPLSL